MGRSQGAQVGRNGGNRGAPPGLRCPARTEHRVDYFVEQRLVVGHPRYRRWRPQHGDPRPGSVGDPPGELPDRLDRHVRVDHEPLVAAREVGDPVECGTRHATLGHRESGRRTGRPGGDADRRAETKVFRAVDFVGRLDPGHRGVRIAGRGAHPGPMLILLDARDAGEKRNGRHVFEVERRRRRFFRSPAAVRIRTNACSQVESGGNRPYPVRDLRRRFQRHGEYGVQEPFSAAQTPSAACSARGGRRRTRRRCGWD